MVSDIMLTFISRRLSEIMDNTLPFGKLNMIVVGDLFQLSPVKGRYAFHNHLLWHLFKPMFLMKNMSQNNDIAYVRILNRARVGLLTDKYIAMLKERLQHCASSSFPSSLHIYPKRCQVHVYNDQQQETFLSKTCTNSDLIAAEHYFSDQDTESCSCARKHYS